MNSLTLSPKFRHQAHADREAALRSRQQANPTTLPLTSSCSYYLDDEKVRSDFIADPMDLPPFEIAKELLKKYMETVHSTYPLVAKDAFVNRFHAYYASIARGQPYQLPPKWQATLNLVLAIGAAYTYYTETEGQSDGMSQGLLKHLLIS
jgi:hypothetical protein